MRTGNPHTPNHERWQCQSFSESQALTGVERPPTHHAFWTRCSSCSGPKILSIIPIFSIKFLDFCAQRSSGIRPQTPKDRSLWKMNFRAKFWIEVVIEMVKTTGSYKGESGKCDGVGALGELPARGAKSGDQLHRDEMMCREANSAGNPFFQIKVHCPCLVHIQIEIPPGPPKRSLPPFSKEIERKKTRKLSTTARI